MKFLFTLRVSVLLVAAVALASACNTPSAPAPQLVSEVISKEAQQAMTPQMVLDELIAGNARFVNNEITARDLSAQVRATADGQNPMAVVVSCLDSRIPVEYVFDQGIGDLFVARVAGNFVNEDILGSAEFATAVVGSRLVVVMGHQACGAVKAAVDDVKVGNITAMLSKIRPVVERTQTTGERTSANVEFVEEVAHANVMYNIEQIRERSPMIAELEQKGEVMIVGAYYNLGTGLVTFM
jgi:carbonic anhydrase